MAWRFVQQPNGYLARFSETIDDFTDYDLDDFNAVELCIEEHQMIMVDAMKKIARARENPSRFEEAVEIIRNIHGNKIALNRINQLSHKQNIKP